MSLWVQRKWPHGKSRSAASYLADGADGAAGRFVGD
jgi:hypothetical protein